KNAMQGIGLENVKLEPCMVPHWERGTIERLTISDTGREPAPRLNICALGGSPPTVAGGLEAEVVMVKSLAELEALGEKARGKAVFFDRAMDPCVPDPFAAYGGAVDQRSAGGTAAF